MDNNLVSQYQPNFKPGNFYFNHVLLSTPDILKSFDLDITVKKSFLDISKAFV